MAVKRLKGGQAKLKDPHHTSVVDVSCPSITYSQVRWARQIEYDQKDVNGGTDDISGVDRIWCEGARNKAPCWNLFISEKIMLCSHVTTQRKLVDLWEANAAMAPKLFP